MGKEMTLPSPSITCIYRAACPRCHRPPVRGRPASPAPGGVWGSSAAQGLLRLGHDLVLEVSVPSGFKREW